MIGAAHARFHVGLFRPAVAVSFLAAVVAAAFGKVNFAADDGLDVTLAGFIEEIRSSEKIAVVRDEHGGHLLARCLIQQLGSFAGPVEQAVIGVNVQMNELRLPHKLDSKTPSGVLHYAI